jgi:ketosteroid isomerase-like protein
MARSPEQDQNVELARGGIQSWIDGDRDAAMETIAEDVEVFVPSELGNAGTYRGIEEFLRWNAQWEEAWSDFQMEVVSAEPVGERHVVCLIRSRGRGAGSGVEVGNELGWVLEVRGESLAFLGLQPSHEDAVALAERREREG